MILITFLFAQYTESESMPACPTANSLHIVKAGGLLPHFFHYRCIEPGFLMCNILECFFG